MDWKLAKDKSEVLRTIKQWTKQINKQTANKKKRYLIFVGGIERDLSHFCVYGSYILHWTTAELNTLQQGRLWCVTCSISLEGYTIVFIYKYWQLKSFELPNYSSSFHKYQYIHHRLNMQNTSSLWNEIIKLPRSTEFFFFFILSWLPATDCMESIPCNLLTQASMPGRHTHAHQFDLICAPGLDSV